MVMPEDPVMLLSFVNMKLRDFYGSLDALCEECGVDKARLVEKLKKIDYVYDEERNQFKEAVKEVNSLVKEKMDHPELFDMAMEAVGQ